ncbi:MAG: protein-L-isoaspartate(D-aspartate) O-methyltransferase [Oceanipulchritudo sp.]
MKWPFQERDEIRDDAAAREAMVRQQLKPRGISDPNVLRAMGTVPRHEFVPPRLRDMAYADGPLPIGNGQTISQPYIVAVMSEALELQPGMKVLEVGTGSGYQAAVLAEMGLEVYSVEYIAELADAARALLERIGYGGIHFRTGDGREGWPEAAPFDGILVTAAPGSLPGALGGQLRPGGRLVIPVGRWEQNLHVYRKRADGSLEGEILFAVRFVPLV